MNDMIGTSPIDLAPALVHNFIYEVRTIYSKVPKRAAHKALAAPTKVSRPFARLPYMDVI